MRSSLFKTCSHSICACRVGLCAASPPIFNPILISLNTLFPLPIRSRFVGCPPPAGLSAAIPHALISVTSCFNCNPIGSFRISYQFKRGEH
jgi:hypothetical protein